MFTDATLKSAPYFSYLLINFHLIFFKFFSHKNGHKALDFDELEMHSAKLIPLADSPSAQSSAGLVPNLETPAQLRL